MAASKKAGRPAVETALQNNALLKFFEDKEPEFDAPRPYTCEIHGGREFYFLHPSMAIDKAAHGGNTFKGGTEQTVAKYWMLACDAQGNRFCKSMPEIKAAVEKSMIQRSFRDHCLNAMDDMGELGKKDPADNPDGIPGDEAGTLENEKKESSSTAVDA
jgi:hypothetical protein